MLTAERNALITQSGPGTPLGALMRQYWQPAALVDEFDGPRPVRPVRLLGEDLVLFRDEAVCHAWTARPEIFELSPHHLIPGPNT